ncbi:MAG TPA: hypothetical protein VM032_00840 [Vicinamibacterales bacterium]|nr:hypothetical protein [Vicinamibacterales bacterium]
MKTLLATVCLCTGIVAGAATQELPPPFPRTNATKLFENDRINVWNIVWPRGEPTALHRHIYDQVGTYYERGGRTITTPDGGKRSSVTEVGSLSTTRKGTTHIEEGNTDPPLRAVFIELKQEKPGGLSPAATGRASFPHPGAKQVLDDDRVTVWDVASWAAGPQALTFRPARETVIVWLGDGLVRSTRGGAPSTVPVKAGTTRHLDRGADETLDMVGGSPRALFFELK